MFPLGLLACTAPDSADPVTDSPSDSSAASTPTFDMPWDQEGFWTNPGPLAPMMDREHRPPAPFWAVWVATSSDGQSWSAPQFPIALGLSSLNLLTTDAGVLITGVVDQRVYAREGLDLPPTNAIYALVSADLQIWGSQSWTLHDAASTLVIDPGFWLDAENVLHAAWYGTTFAGDPAQAPGPHSIRGATWNGREFSVQSADLYAKENLADPTICRMGQEYWMFVTEAAQRVRAARSTDGQAFLEDPDFRWDQVTVPWCRAEDDHLVLLGQTNGGTGAPAQLQLNADGSTTNLESPYRALPFAGNDCTSLAVAQYKSTWILVCAASYLE